MADGDKLGRRHWDIELSLALREGRKSVRLAADASSYDGESSNGEQRLKHVGRVKRRKTKQ